MFSILAIYNDETWPNSVIFRRSKFKILPKIAVNVGYNFAKSGKQNDSNKFWCRLKAICNLRFYLIPSRELNYCRPGNSLNILKIILLKPNNCKNWRLPRDSNLDRQTIKARLRWPLDHHHGPVLQIFRIKQKRERERDRDWVCLCVPHPPQTWRAHRFTTCLGPGYFLYLSKDYFLK